MQWISPEFLITTGYVGLFAVIFAESGLFFGFFFPGDSLLLTAGLLASHAESGLDIKILVPLLFVAAVLGDNVGYWFGFKAGPRIFNRENSLLFRRKNLLAAKDFYERHGGKTIVLARFMPFIRTFAPIVAGAAEMEYRRFFGFNLLGGFLWACCVTLIGYTLGNVVPGIDKYFTPIVLLVIFISVLPTAIHLWRSERHEIMAALRRRFSRADVEAK
ncbi:MAG: VTT domain-containing protein [Chloroflexi bacterium]|nr:VTT domain-containing protein [Chloroflexota bacterium]